MDGLRRIQSFDEIGYPGLGTVFYTCFVVALFFLVRQGLLNHQLLSQLMSVSVPLFAALMVAPIRYPKLVKFKSILLPVVVGLGLMPFFVTSFLAVLTVVVIFLYVVVSPFLVSQRPLTADLRSCADVTGRLSHKSLSPER
jgi:phosphatidylserine synthase